MKTNSPQHDPKINNMSFIEKTEVIKEEEYATVTQLKQWTQNGNKTIPIRHELGVFST
jgi:hypothetical protein